MALKKEEQELHDKAVAEWLAKGNKITVCEPFQRSDQVNTKFNRWKGRPKKKVDKSE